MNPYQVIKAKRVTEKGRVLENLVNAKSNKCLARCESPKIVFDVDSNANKRQIAEAVEHIYKDQKVKVEVMIFGRKNLIELNALQVEKYHG